MKERSSRNRLKSGIKKEVKNQGSTRVCKESRDKDCSPYSIRLSRGLENMSIALFLFNRIFVTEPRGTGLSVPEARAPRPILKAMATQLGIHLHLTMPF